MEAAEEAGLIRGPSWLPSSDDTVSTLGQVFVGVQSMQRGHLSPSPASISTHLVVLPCPQGRLPASQRASPRPPPPPAAPRGLVALLGWLGKCCRQLTLARLALTREMAVPLVTFGFSPRVLAASPYVFRAGSQGWEGCWAGFRGTR